MDYQKHNQKDSWDDGVYGTGITEPPKDHGGIIALMLILIIFLSGIVSVLSFWNIKLFRELQQIQHESDSVPMAFSDMEASSASEDHILPEADGHTESVNVPSLGLTGEYVSQFDQHYFSWPAGLLVTDVKNGSEAEQLGIESGDILISINDTSISSQEDLDQIINSVIPEGFSRVVIYREGQHCILNGNKNQ